MRIPSFEIADNMFNKYNVPDNIKKHCLKVSQSAEKIAKTLSQKGVKIDIDIVLIGAYMHDLMKAVTLEKLEKNDFFNYKGPTKDELETWEKLKLKYKGMHETDIIAEILKPEYPEFAEFMVKVGEYKTVENSLEVLIIQYADFRTLGTNTVTIEERVKYLQGKYIPNTPTAATERIELELKRVKKIEDITSFIGLEKILE